MPVYHFTLHAYRSWSPANPRGYVRRGKGILPTDKRAAEQYDKHAKQTQITFTPDIQRVLIAGSIEICSRRNWRLHAIATETTHAHFVMSWKGFTPWLDVVTRLKNPLSLFLGRELETPGRRWFVRGQSRRRVTNRKHFDYLIAEYLPSHSGLFWREGSAPPRRPRASARGYQGKL